MSEALFDSNIVVDVLAGRQSAVAEIDRHSGVAISVITWIEVMAGARNRADEDALRHTLGGYILLQLAPDIAARAATIRRDRRIKLPDAIIQATAEVHRLLLVTRNERDFPATMPGVHIPYRF